MDVLFNVCLSLNPIPFHLRILGLIWLFLHDFTRQKPIPSLSCPYITAMWLQRLHRSGLWLQYRPPKERKEEKRISVENLTVYVDIVCQFALCTLNFFLSNHEFLLVVYMNLMKFICIERNHSICCTTATSEVHSFKLKNKWKSSREIFLNHFLFTCVEVWMESLFDKKLPGNFIKKNLQHRCFLVNIVEFLRSTVLKSICKRLLFRHSQSK